MSAKLTALSQFKKEGSGVPESVWPSLHQAAGENDVEEVKELLDKGADINEGEHCIAGYTPLALAVSQGNIDLVKLLLERGADPNKGNSCISPLHLANLHGHEAIYEAIAELLRQHGGKDWVNPDLD